jgi:hypothetical protein
MDLGIITSVGSIVLGAGVGLLARRAIAANDQRRADAASSPAAQDTPPQAGAPKAAKTLRLIEPAGHR